MTRKFWNKIRNSHTGKKLAIFDTPIYYHTDVFHWKINLALVIIGLVALTSLVVGILAALHIVNIPSQAMYGTLIAGGGVLFIESIVLIVLIVRHHQHAKPMVEFLELETANRESWTYCFNCGLVPREESSKLYAVFNEKNIYYVLQVSPVSRSIHLFLDPESWAAHIASLYDYAERKWTHESETGDSETELSDGAYLT